ncbi:hypothetical protein SAMN05192545_3951 [Maribacter dokdonensis]|uniref:Hydrolases of HD superfamily n=1 Tax=Maribacter dokdonensis TaxID=320912 RepID=A0ABY0V0F2_9FLAO|nr:hypothetical protein [Maribacter dokdonensis]SDT46562.1 hypothetical protein SAMN05192545_3899 [Maribacter dokdonensis]SDT47836.1 hypothetical protein SAMN05192545_3951 [Maribacter dokdonensis]
MTHTQIIQRLYKKDCIRTHSGLYLNVVNPKPDQICIEDIAHALSRVPRFAGHLDAFFSVAQHSLNVSHLSPDEYKLEGLLHDATEAYLADLPSPLKNHCPGYKELEARLYYVIAKKYGIPSETSLTVKNVDRMMLETEFRTYHIGKAEVKSTPDKIKRIFIEQFKQLSNDR